MPHVGVMSLRYHGDMTDDVTGENPDAPWRFSLRGTVRERNIVQRVVQAHRKMGINISLNEAVLVLIRRAATPDADTEEEARAQIEQHWAQCTFGCSEKTWPPKCPEGWRLYDAYQRVADRRRRNPSPAPPPPLDNRPEPLWRRYLGFERERQAS